jgi:hypothetical protein
VNSRDKLKSNANKRIYERAFSRKVYLWLPPSVAPFVTRVNVRSFFISGDIL